MGFKILGIKYPKIWWYRLKKCFYGVLCVQISSCSILIGIKRLADFTSVFASDV